MLAELKAHKDAKTWLLTATAHEQQRTNNLMLTYINSVVAGKSIVLHLLFPQIALTTIHLFYLFTVGLPVAPRPLGNVWHLKSAATNSQDWPICHRQRTTKRARSLEALHLVDGQPILPSSNIKC